MTVAELIALLQGYPQEAKVLIHQADGWECDESFFGDPAASEEVVPGDRRVDSDAKVPTDSISAVVLR